MPDRIELDALLIGALYGELTPADEARLTAHLESHPADRTALSDLTRTRAAVRESRILAFQLEPPQGISALLLREASRRAPRPARETGGWFQRLVRSFMAHPAMAAAAMLVLVVSVAGTLYLRGGNHFASPKLEATSSQPATSAPDQTRGQDPALVAPAAPAEPVTPLSVPAAEPQAPPQNAGAPVAAGAGSASAGMAGSESADGYRVRLEEKQQPARNDLASPGRSAPPPSAKAKGAAKADRSADDNDLPAPAKLAKKPSGIEIHSPQPQPKELKDTDVGDAKKSEAAPGGGAATPPAVPSRAPARPPSPSTQAALNQEEPSPAPEPAAQSPSDGKRATAKPVTRGASAAAAPPPPPPPPAATTAPSSDAAANTRDGRAADKAADANASKNSALLSWARKQHDQVISLVGSSDCHAAASAAAEIYNRAPSYYAANVVTDRQVRPCLPYLNSERDRQDRVRASKRALRTDDASRTDRK
jgi:hypothetical protein